MARLTDVQTPEMQAVFPARRPLVEVEDEDELGVVGHRFLLCVCVAIQLRRHGKPVSTAFDDIRRGERGVKAGKPREQGEGFSVWGAVIWGLQAGQTREQGEGFRVWGAGV